MRGSSALAFPAWYKLIKFSAKSGYVVYAVISRMRMLGYQIVIRCPNVTQDSGETA